MVNCADRTGCGAFRVLWPWIPIPIEIGIYTTPFSCKTVMLHSKAMSLQDDSEPTEPCVLVGVHQIILFYRPTN